MSLVLHYAKLVYFNYRILKTISKQLHTGVFLSARFKKANNSKSFKSFSQNNELEEETEFGEDFESDLDFSNSNFLYDQHMSEKEISKKRIAFKITAKKFFAPEKLPSMLTYNEKLCIQYLHKTDPVHWDIYTLSESFPAIPEVIKKVIKNEHKLSPEKIAALDSIVEKNWELLKEGKLDVKPEVLEHLKKFVNRRETLLERIKSGNFFLPEIKETKKKWNHGEMSNILKHYEKSITELENEFKKKHYIPLNTSDSNSEQMKSEKNNNENNNMRSNKICRHESVLLGKMVKHLSKPEVDYNEKFDLSDLDKNKNLKQTSEPVLNFGKQNYENFWSNKNKKKFVSPKKFDVTQEGLEKLVKLKKEVSLNVENIEETTTNNYYDKINKEEKLVNNTVNLGNTIFMKEYMATEKFDNYKEAEPDQKIFVRKKSVERFENLLLNNPERKIKDDAFYKKEVDEIKNTVFWHDGKNKKQKSLIEFEKMPLCEPKDIDKINKADVVSLDSYPEKIKLPKNKKGSGLTFKVKDCYYDDDGKFLYRVPGMVN